MEKRTVLITGCSTGIGKAAAIRLKEENFHVIASARKTEDVKALTDMGFSALQLDLNDSQSIENACKAALSQCDNRIYGLINNAGYGSVGAVEDVTRNALRQQFETNVFGLIELSNRLLPTMRSHNEGRIINISSVLGLVSFPYRGPYNASKFAVEALSDALRLELSQDNIFVSLVEPGPIESQFRDSALNYYNEHLRDIPSAHKKRYQYMLDDFINTKKKTPFTLPPEAVVNRIIEALNAKKPKARYFVTTPTYLLALAKRLLPTFLLDRLVNRIL